MRAGVLFLICWSCDSIDLWVLSNWDCRDASVAQSCIIDSRSCWDAGSENTDVLFFSGELLESVSRSCETCWVNVWILFGIFWDSSVDVELDEECDVSWICLDALRVMRIDVCGEGI